MSVLDPRIRIRPSKAVKDLILDLIDEDIKVPESMTNDFIFPSDLRWLMNNHAERFQTAFRGCDMILPEVEYPKRSPELEERCRKLRAEQENKEYAKMTSGLSGVGLGNEVLGSDDSIKKQLSEINNYLILVVQFVVSVATAFAAGFFAPYLFYGIEDVGKRLIIGVILGFVVGIADLYFIIRHFLVIEGVIDKRKVD